MLKLSITFFIKIICKLIKLLGYKIQKNIKVSFNNKKIINNNKKIKMVNIWFILNELPLIWYKIIYRKIKLK